MRNDKEETRSRLSAFDIFSEIMKGNILFETSCFSNCFSHFDTFKQKKYLLILESLWIEDLRSEFSSCIDKQMLKKKARKLFKLKSSKNNEKITFFTHN